ncbi:MAG TPA: helix-turn-helix domain-containing protein, partial [Terriglobia bacterium]|nr:helix-turn-helix domain-containing protein [Terriglobia bacterium]
EDLPLLIRSFLSLYAARHKKDLTLSAEALDCLMGYLWPGNVRELRNVIEGCVALNRSGTVQAADLPAEVRSRAQFTGPGSQENPRSREALLELPYKDAKRQFEVDYISARLQQNHGNVSRTAAQIGLHRQSLQQKLRELGIER